MELPQELVARHARDSVDRKPPWTAEQQGELRPRIVLPERAEAAQVLGSNRRPVFYFDRPEAVTPVHDEVDFVAGLRAPEVERGIDLAVVEPGPQVLRDEPLERRPSDLLGPVERSGG